jgi:hypothetical protein
MWHPFKRWFRREMSELNESESHRLLRETWDRQREMMQRLRALEIEQDLIGQKYVIERRRAPRDTES